MFKRRISSSIYFFFLLVIIATALIIDLIVEQHITAEMIPEVRQGIEEKAHLIIPRLEEALWEGGEDRLLRTLHLVEEESKLSITLFNLTGAVLYDSTSTAQHFDTSIERPEVKQLLSDGKTYLIRHSPGHGTRTMFIGRTLMRNGLNFGYIRFSHPLTRMEHRLQSVRGSILLGALLAILLAIFPALLLSLRFTRPIEKIHLDLKEYDAGNKVELKTAEKNEFGKLTDALRDHFESLDGKLDALQSERDWFASILCGMVEGVIAINESEEILYINSFAAAILGAERNQCEGKPLWEVCRKPSISDAILSALDHESAATSEARLVDERGDRFIKIYTSAIMNEDGHQTGAVVVLQDVTTLRKLADFRQDMITNVSHEFKTPLTAIMGITETMLEIPDLEEEKRQEFLKRIMVQAERLRTLATDVLELSRIENHDGTSRHSPQDIRKIIRQTFETLTPRANLKKLEMQYEEDVDPVVVNCEEQSILQIAENLIDNAIKYTNEGDSIHVSVRKNGSKATITIKDNGPGIEISELDRIFERFYRTQAARTPRTKGTGLGLAIIKSIVSSYEGDILVESEPGKGSQFTVTLPVYSTVD